MRRLLISHLSRIMAFVNRDAMLKRLCSGMFWVGLGTFLSKFLVLCATILAARLLGKEAFGQFNMIRDTCGMMGTFAGLGLGLTLVKYVSELKSNDSQYLSEILGGIFLVGFLSVAVISIGTLGGSDLLASRLLNAPDLSIALRFGVLMFIGSAGSYFLNNALVGLEKFKAMTLIGMIEGILCFPSVLIGCHFMGVNGIILGFSFTSFVSLAWQWILFHREIRHRKVVFSYRLTRELWRVLFKFSMPTFCASLMATPVYWLVRVFLTKYPGGYAELGIYSAAFRFQGMLMLISGVINSAMLPLLGSKEGKSHNILNIGNIVVPWVVGICISMPIMFFPELIQIAYGPDYAGRSFRLSLSLVMFSCVVILFKQGIQRNMITKNLMWFSLISNTIWALLMIYGSYLFVNHGAIGLSGVTAGVYLITLLVFYPFYIKLGVLNKQLALNRYVLGIWLFYGVASVFSLFDTNIIFRGCVVLMAMSVILLFLFKFMRQRKSIVFVD